MTDHGSKKRARDLKVVIMGAADVGKTSLIHRYIDGSFKQATTTLGASFSLKQWHSYHIALWDTAGEERFSGLSAFYCRGAGAVIFAFDLTNEDSFHALRARFAPLLSSAREHCLAVVVGTKQDLLTSQDRTVSQDDAILLAKELNSTMVAGLPYFETSSKSGQQVDDVFEYIFHRCLIETQVSSDIDKSIVNIHRSSSKSSCCHR